jgi:hypothetical protein
MDGALPSAPLERRAGRDARAREVGIMTNPGIERRLVTGDVVAMLKSGKVRAVRRARSIDRSIDRILSPLVPAAHQRPP